MTPIRNNFLAKISDSLKLNQISNGVYSVRLQQCSNTQSSKLFESLLARSLMG